MNDNFDETNDNYDNDPSALVKITMYQLLLLKSIENVQILYSLSLNTKHHFFEIRNIQRPDTEYYFTRDDIHIKKLHVIFVRYYSSVSNKRGVLIRGEKGWKILQNKLSKGVGINEGLDFCLFW